MKPIQRMFARQMVAALALGCVTAVSAAQDFKIGFVNTDRIFREASLAKTAQNKLEQEFSMREREVESLASQL